MPPSTRTGGGARSAARNLVNLEGVRKAYGTRTLLDGVSLGVATGERIGIVGRNGDGKTTLLRIMGQLEPVDAGRVTHASGLRPGMLPQHDDLDPAATVRQVVLGDLAAHEWAGEAGVRDVLTGLFGGLDLPGLPQGLDTVVGPLSGGERRRIALAALLVADHVTEQDLLLLDEPTNHLDVEGIDWLARHLSARRGGLLVVTHDRWFLDTVCERTWEVQGGAVHDYEGGYSAYVLARAERARIAASEESRRSNLLRKELAWLRRGPPARTSKPRFRIDAANALIADEPPARDAVRLLQFANSRLGRTVYELHDATVAAGEKVLLERLTWHVGPGDRLGVVGVNGSGKTTLLRTLIGLAPLVTGRLVTGVTVRAAYLSQEVAELPPALRVLEAVEAVRRVVELGGGRQITASQLSERFGFTGDKQWTPVGDLSGGERRRLQLLRLLMDEPNVLVLDEPTNDLDIETLTALEDLLDDWPGTLLVVSHDRYFLERVCDRTVALLGDARLRELPGGVEEYLHRRRELAKTSSADATSLLAAPAQDGRAVADAARRRVPDAAGRRAPDAGGRTPSGFVAAPSSGEARAGRKELARLERVVARLGQREAALHEELARQATDFERVGALGAELQAVVAEKIALEEEWLVLAERLD